MALVKIYDAEGNEFEREAVDARECMAAGGYSLEPPATNPADTGDADDPKPDGGGKAARKK